MSQLPCAVERDRFEAALEAETERIYSEWVSFPENKNPRFMAEAIWMACARFDPALMAAIKAFARKDYEDLGRLLADIFKTELRKSAAVEAERRLKKLMGEEAKQ